MLADLGLGALAVIAGAVAAVAGFGIGSLLTPALGLLLGTKAAVAVVAVPHALATGVRLWALRDAIDRHVLASFGVASAAGGLAGAILHSVAGSPGLSIVLGVLLVVAGVLELTGILRRVVLGGRLAAVAGIASGVFGGLVGNQGGIRSAALLRFDLAPRALVATATATAILVDVARVPVYAVTDGADLVSNVDFVAILALGTIVGTVFGGPILRRLPERRFRQALAVALIALGAALIAGLGG